MYIKKIWQFLNEGFLPDFPYAEEGKLEEIYNHIMKKIENPNSLEMKPYKLNSDEEIRWGISKKAFVKAAVYAKF